MIVSLAFLSDIADSGGGRRDELDFVELSVEVKRGNSWERRE